MYKFKNFKNQFVKFMLLLWFRSGRDEVICILTYTRIVYLMDTEIILTYPSFGPEQIIVYI